MTPSESGAAQVVAGEVITDDAAQAIPERVIAGGERWLFGVALAVLLLDQLFKWWVRGALAPNAEMSLIGGVVHLSHVANRGAAWGMFSGQRALLVGVSVVVVGALAMTARQIAARGLLVALAMGFIFGGAVGNLIDRIVSGAVTDMIDMDTNWALIRNFPVFNIADSALTIGVILLIWHSLFGSRDKSTP